MPRTLVAALSFAAIAAQAHVVLPPGGAAAGSRYAAAFQVGHACSGARNTTALSVRLPAGFTLVAAEPRPGWTVVATPERVTWTAAEPAAALPADRAATFVVVGRLRNEPGTLWFDALQTCDIGSVQWATVPTAADPQPARPAARLDVLPPGTAAVDVRAAWTRPTVPGQTTTGVYAELSAPAGARLVGASTPLGEATLHEMTMDGNNVMRMRALDGPAGGVDLPPGRSVALAPGGLHVMVTGLRQPLAEGSKLPLTLRFVDREGRRGDVRLDVAVSQQPAAAAEHRH